jgi:hypothetical protein
MMEILFFLQSVALKNGSSPIELHEQAVVCDVLFRDDQRNPHQTDPEALQRRSWVRTQRKNCFLFIVLTNFIRENNAPLDFNSVNETRTIIKWKLK